MKSSIPPPALDRSRIGRYEVIYPLGQGGMASVYIGRLVGMAGFERLVAIKVIHPHLSSNPLFVEMFLDEARLAASIHHPNVGEIFEVGEDDGMFFMVGELVQGESLRSLLRRARVAGGEMPAYLAAHIAAEVCKGLSAAHGLRNPEGEPLRLVHRDVSPRNVLLAYDGFVKLIDFGVAWAHGKSAHTEVGTIKGNVSYMSPEQICGQDLDRRSDLFSLGIVLYEMLTGSSPFPGKDKIERMHKILRGAFPRPREVKPKLDPFLEKTLLRSLEHHPDDRYGSAEAFGLDLEEYIHRSGKAPLAQAMASYMRGLFADDIVIFDRKLRDYRRRTPFPGQLSPYGTSGSSSRPSNPLGVSSQAPRKAELPDHMVLAPSVSQPAGTPAPSSKQPRRPGPDVDGALHQFVVEDETQDASAVSGSEGSHTPLAEHKMPRFAFEEGDDSSISINIPFSEDSDHGFDVCHSGYLQKLIEEELTRSSPKDDSSGGAGAGAAPVAVQGNQGEDLVTVSLPPFRSPTMPSMAPPPAPDSTTGQPMAKRDSVPPGHSLPRWLAVAAAALLALTLVLPSSHPLDQDGKKPGAVENDSLDGGSSSPGMAPIAPVVPGPPIEVQDTEDTDSQPPDGGGE